MKKLLKQLRKKIDKDISCIEIKKLEHMSPLCSACNVVNALRTLEEFYCVYDNKEYTKIPIIK